LKILKPLSKRLTKYYIKLYYALFWNGILRYILESYLAVTLVNLQKIFDAGLIWSNPVQIVFSLVTLITIIFYIVAPMCMTVYFRRFVNKFYLTSFNKRFRDVTGDLQPKESSSPNFFVIFCYRRLVASLLIVLLQSHSSF
jgi:predicted membrane protein